MHCCKQVSVESNRFVAHAHLICCDVTHSCPLLPSSVCVSLCVCVCVCAGIRARCLCAQGDLVGAVAVGRKGLDPGQHDSLAAFLALQGGVAGAHLALLGLQGLSLAMEAELCMVTGEGKGGVGVDGYVCVPRGGGLRGTFCARRGRVVVDSWCAE